VESAKHRGEWIDSSLSRITLGEWAAKGLAAQVQLKPLTRERYRNIVRVQILPTWEKVRLAEVTHADVVAWLAAMQADEDRHGDDQTGASCVLADALAGGARPTALLQPGRGRPAPARLAKGTGVPLARPGRSSGRRLSGLRAVHPAARLHRPPLGEATALQVKRLDLMRRRLEVVRTAIDLGREVSTGTPKTHQHRSVPIPRSLVDRLIEHVAGKDPEDLVVTSPRGAPLRNHNFRRRVFTPAAVAIGVPQLTPHDLRHTAASLAVQAGANVKAVQRMLGHASAAMTLDVYAGLLGDDLDAVADRLDEAAAKARADHLRTQGDDADVLPIDFGGVNGL
jgi:integrase